MQYKNSRACQITTPIIPNAHCMYPTNDLHYTVHTDQQPFQKSQWGKIFSGVRLGNLLELYQGDSSIFEAIYNREQFQIKSGLKWRAYIMCNNDVYRFAKYFINLPFTPLSVRQYRDLSLVSITCNAKGTCFYYRDH